MVIADKGYDTDDFQKALLEKGLHSGVIKKNNRKSKIKELDKWLTKLRSPFEGPSFMQINQLDILKGFLK